jgi:Regulator of chromosome condensation (RCC1) repeat
MHSYYLCCHSACYAVSSTHFLLVVLLSLAVVVHIYICILLSLYALCMIGSKGPIQFGKGLTVKAVACGDLHSCVILSDNATRCFGAGAKGQLVSYR